MMNLGNASSTEQQQSFLKSLVAFTKDHKASHWSGPVSEFLEKILPARSARAPRVPPINISGT